MTLCAQSAPTLAALAALAYAIQTWKSIVIWSHLPVSSLTSNFLYSWSSTRAVSPFLVLMVSASCRRGNALPSSRSSSRNSRRTSRMLAEIRNSMNSFGSCRSSSGEIGEGGCRGLASSLWDHGWPRNLFGQTETYIMIPFQNHPTAPEEREIKCKLQWTNDENVKWSSLGRHFEQIWLVPMPSSESAWHRSEPWAHQSTTSNISTCCYCWCKCPVNIYNFIHGTRIRMTRVLIGAGTLFWGVK